MESHFIVNYTQSPALSLNNTELFFELFPVTWDRIIITGYLWLNFDLQISVSHRFPQYQ